MDSTKKTAVVVVDGVPVVDDDDDKDIFSLISLFLCLIACNMKTYTHRENCMSAK